jgi:hypothetical protein
MDAQVSQKSDGSVNPELLAAVPIARLDRRRLMRTHGIV